MKMITPTDRKLLFSMKSVTTRKVSVTHTVDSRGRCASVAFQNVIQLS